MQKMKKIIMNCDENLDKVLISLQGSLGINRSSVIRYCVNEKFHNLKNERT